VKNDPGNRLYYGDNLAVLREHIADESVDLVYLDPPFNSNAGYNVLFKTASGIGADASIEAFDDTWTWGQSSQEALLDIASGTNRRLQVMMDAMHRALGENPLMAYLAMMAVRLVELHRVLKPTGSLYLHCDPTASHYLKLILDAVFGPRNYQAEIIWRRTNSRSTTGKWPRLHDTILHFAKSREAVFHSQTVAGEAARTPHTLITGTDGLKYNTFELTGAGRTRDGESGRPWRGFAPDALGRHWGYSMSQLDEWAAGDLIHFPKNGGFPRRRAETPFDPQSRCITVGDVWSDIDRLNQTAKERLGFPTQKPRALLERLIAASSNPGDLVLDPFCGCGTAVDAAQKLGRHWIGIDITHLAIGMIEDRMRAGYPEVGFETIGVPRDLASAERLARDDPHQFQQWVCWQAGGFPRDRKGGDKGVDGWFNHVADGGRIATGVISVKAGDIVNPTMVRDLGRVMQRDGHRFGLFITKARPTRGMREEAASHPPVETEWGRFPALQIVTLAELMLGHRPKLPPLVGQTSKARRVDLRRSHQPGAQGALL